MPFKSIEEMSEETPLQLNGTHLRSKASLKKQFRWFYTNYVFSETFYCVGDTFQLADTLYADLRGINLPDQLKDEVILLIGDDR